MSRVYIVNNIARHFDQFNPFRRVQIGKRARLTLKDETGKVNRVQFLNILAYCLVVNAGRYSSILSVQKTYISSETKKTLLVGGGLNFERG